MVRPGKHLPIGAAMALTVSAGLAIAQERARSLATGVAAQHTTYASAHAAGPNAIGGQARNKAGESKVVPQHAKGGHSAPAPTTAVGSRGLVGSEDDPLGPGMQPCWPATHGD
jgi:hypothetical protein